VLELLPGGFVDFAAAGHRRAKIQRIAHETLFIETATERMFTAPLKVASAEQQCRCNRQGCARVHRRFVSNSR
jgi:hypothetical protein